MIRPTSIRRALSGLLTSALLATLFAVALPATAAAAAVCTPTGFVRDGIDLTAAKINPPGTVTGDVDATGCNIGIYYGPGKTGTVSTATVHGANYFGVVNNGGHVDVKRSSIHDIGESPLNGSQHGIGIAFVQDTLGSHGDITDNRVWLYQKGGIVVRGLGNKAKKKPDAIKKTRRQRSTRPINAPVTGQGEQGLEQRRDQHERLGSHRRGLPGRDQRVRQPRQDREEPGLRDRLYASGHAAPASVLHRHDRGDQPIPQEQQDHHEVLTRS